MKWIGFLFDELEILDEVLFLGLDSASIADVSEGEVQIVA
jgi:hypothetical protein